MKSNDTNIYFKSEYGLSLQEYKAIEFGNSRVNKNRHHEELFPTDKTILNSYFKREYGMSCEEFLKLDLSVQTIRHNKKERLLKK